MQRMAEFVEQRAGVVEAEQTWGALCGFGEVHHIDHQRPDVACKLLLIAQGRHPGAAMLGRAREIITEEKADMLAVRAAHLPDANVRMPDRNVIEGRE